VIDRIGTTMVFDDLDDALRAVRVRSSFSHNTEPI
jgi:sulfate permease, SulP family